MNWPVLRSFRMSSLAFPLVLAFLVCGFAFVADAWRPIPAGKIFATYTGPVMGWLEFDRYSEVMTAAPLAIGFTVVAVVLILRRQLGCPAGADPEMATSEDSA